MYESTSIRFANVAKNQLQEWREKRVKLIGCTSLESYKTHIENDWNKLKEKAKLQGCNTLNVYGIFTSLNWRECRAFMQQLGINPVTKNLSRELFDWCVRYELVRALGYDDLEDYEIHKEVDWAHESVFNGVIIYPVDQIYLIQTAFDAEKSPELMMKGMDYPVDYALRRYLTMIRRKGVFVGYEDKRIELQQREFPCGMYDRDYEAVEELLRVNGWEHGVDGWSREQVKLENIRSLHCCTR
jgi:hypothetical protein